MNFKKGIGFGLLLWVIMFVIVSALIAFKIYNSDEPGVMSWVVAVVGGFVSLILAGYLKPRSAGGALGYGLTFVVVGLILDLLITTRFNPGILGEAPIWVSYVLVFLAPLLRVKKAVASSPMQ